MRPLPFTDVGARIAFYAVFGTFLALEFRIRVRSGLNRHGSRLDRSSLLVVWFSAVLGLTSAFALARGVRAAAIRDLRWPLFVIGLVVMAAGITIRQWAVVVLGQFFTTDVRVRPDQTVVEEGPYGYVRHPSYAGLLIIFLGVGLALGNWAALGTLIVVPTIGLVYRIHVEERALLDGLGEPYRRFAASRARLIPRLW